MMKVLVCGSREWVSQAPIERKLRELPPGTILIHGACRGADSIAGFVGELLGFEVRPYPADWKYYSKIAGVIRNQQMLDCEHPDSKGVHIDKVLVFHGNLESSRGSRDMVQRVRKANPPIELIILGY